MRACACIVLVAAVGCGRLQARRVAGAVEAELGIELRQRPALLALETYGWAEEGGDRALLQLGRDDCVRVAARLGTPERADSTAEYARLLGTRHRPPTVVVSRFTQNAHGDHRHYVLDPSSCALYRLAHFE